MTDRPRTFIVRTWLETTNTNPVWRASATDAHSAERHHFSSLESLAWFLFQESGAPHQALLGPPQTDSEPR
jgi:hypothetical protein